MRMFVDFDLPALKKQILKVKKNHLRRPQLPRKLAERDIKSNDCHFKRKRNGVWKEGLLSRADYPREFLSLPVVMSKTLNLVLIFMSLHRSCPQ